MTGWEPVSGTSGRSPCRTRCSARFNPFAEEIDGDWIVYPEQSTPKKHLGDVYLNGTELLRGLDPARRCRIRRCGPRSVDDWTGTVDRIRDPEQTRLVWYAEVGPTQTTIWANFQGADPNAELVEINVRRSVFYPTEHHVDYITVRGFELAQAASPWAPPTADQPGLIGPNWAKGWIIEDNVIHDAKCSAVSIGKEASTGHNYATLRRDKPGYQYQLESVFAARQIGWDREHVGSHIVRRNTIYDCGQNGIVGHLGCVFSTIEDNHIYNIALKREFYGYEIAGIKLHAAIDVDHPPQPHPRLLARHLAGLADPGHPRLAEPLLRTTTATCSSRSATGPTSSSTTSSRPPASLELFSQGGAFVNNLVCGTVLPRARPGPTHARTTCRTAPRSPATPRSTAATTATSATSSSAATPARPTDRRRAPGQRADHGTAGYDGHPASLADYLALGRRSHPRRPRALHGRQAARLHPRQRLRRRAPARSRPSRRPLVLDDSDVTVAVVDEGDEVYLEMPAAGARSTTSASALVTGADLERVRFVDADFEERDGTPAVLDADLVGVDKAQASTYPAGPIAALASGTSRIRVW